MSVDTDVWGGGGGEGVEEGLSAKELQTSAERVQVFFASVEAI